VNFIHIPDPEGQNDGIIPALRIVAFCASQQAEPGSGSHLEFNESGPDINCLEFQYIPVKRYARIPPAAGKNGMKALNRQSLHLSHFLNYCCSQTEIPCLFSNILWFQSPWFHSKMNLRWRSVCGDGIPARVSLRRSLRIRSKTASPRSIPCRTSQHPTAVPVLPKPPRQWT
jgi:hypothetical protein